MRKLDRRGGLRMCSAMLILATGLFVAQPRAADDATPSTKAYPTVPVDLASQVFQDYLPFDVPFRITGTVGKPVQLIRVCYSRDSDESTSTSAAPSSDGCQEGWEPGPTWRRLVATPDDAKFFLHIAPLRSKSTYRFMFIMEREPEPEEVAKFRTEAVTALDDAFRQDFGSVAYDELLRRLNRAIPLKEGESLKHRLWEGKSYVEFQNTFLEQTNGILEGIDLKYAAAETFEEGADRAESILRTLLSEPLGLQALKRDLVEATAREDASSPLQTLASRYAATLAFLATPPDACGRLVRGADAGDYLGIDELWQPGQVDRRLANLAKTRAELDTLLAFVNEAAGLTGSRLDKPIRLIRELNEELELVRWEANGVKTGLQLRAQAIQDMAEGLTTRLREDVVIQGTTNPDFNTRHQYYVSADVGIAATPVIDEIYPYLGTNIYFRPVNKAASFKSLKMLYGGAWSRRVSLMLGITTTDVKKQGQRDGIIGDKGMLLGFGLRLNQSIRLSAGTLVFKEIDPDPLVSKTDWNGTYFVSFSFDWDVRGTFGGIEKALGLDK